MTVKRYGNNPILSPDKSTIWENDAVFNCSVVEDGGKYILMYRAISSEQNWQGVQMKVSSIGFAQSQDGINFTDRKQIIKPENSWEKFGCEDPRITKIDGSFYTFYTAISTWPPNPSGIRVGLAKTKDFNTFEKHLVTPFNAKAMALFPEKINGRFYTILTPNTDLPPARIAIASFEKEEQMWDENYWRNWYDKLSEHVLPLQRDLKDQVELGSVPIKTEKGWLVFYCYIQNYLSNPKTFGIEAILLDLKNPLKILGRTKEPLLVPKEYYELYGNVPNIVFPSGATVKSGIVYLYYGAADTLCCLAEIGLSEILDNMDYGSPAIGKNIPFSPKLIQFEGNPILKPDKQENWSSKAVFNSGAFTENGKIYLLYRAMGESNTSVFGVAVSDDGFHINKKSEKAVYIPREKFESKKKSGNSGCEDPRITKIDDKIYVCYTAFDGYIPRVALTSINLQDFINENWTWGKPVLISPPQIADKDACILPEKVNGKYILFHRIEPSIWISESNTLNFGDGNWIKGSLLFGPREDKWDDEKVGIGATPIRTDLGWLLIYHGISKSDDKYRLGAALLDLNDPTKVILRLDEPILEPDTKYSNEGIRPGAVFTCGAAVLNDVLFVYYGAADQVLCVSRVCLKSFLDYLKTKL